jgi:hypothetical protein
MRSPVRHRGRQGQHRIFNHGFGVDSRPFDGYLYLKAIRETEFGNMNFRDVLIVRKIALSAGANHPRSVRKPMLPDTLLKMD